MVPTYSVAREQDDASGKLLLFRAVVLAITNCIVMKKKKTRNKENLIVIFTYC